MKSFAIIGGDRRNAALAERFLLKGYKVKLYGFIDFGRPLPMHCKNLNETISCADVVIGPMPCAQHGGLFNAPFHNVPVPAADIFALMCPKQVFMAGYIGEEILALAAARDIRVVDLLTREELLVANAIPTAEGAIKIAIEETDVTLHGNPVVVIGYGRIGTVLAAGLRGLGAKVCVVVNTAEAEAKARSAGHETVMFEKMAMRMGTAMVIFNTVPQIILSKCNMRHIDKKAVLIDLASPPYGINAADAKVAGLKTLYASSLPGKVAPVTAAVYIFEAVRNTLRELAQAEALRQSQLRENAGLPNPSNKTNQEEGM